MNNSTVYHQLPSIKIALFLLISIFLLTFSYQVEAQSLPLTIATSLFVGIEATNNAGSSVAFVGDVNNDGCDDLLIGAPKNSDLYRNSGAAYLIFSSSKMPPKLTSLTYADVAFGVNIFRIALEPQSQQWVM